MKINEASRCVGYNERVVEEAYVLTKLLSETGDSSKSGYLDDSITGMSLDEFGNLQFDSYREKEGRKINSTGVVYGDCVLIKQQESVGNRDYYQMYSWDVPHKCYTYISFDKEKAMTNCYDKLRRGQVNLHHEDISVKFSELGISFDDIAQVRLHQDMKSFTLDDMFKARVANQDTDVSLNVRR